ncbi:DNA repair protein RecO [Paenibacillus doosanensis]|uniref:DNA repair protein RecO n=1 Tax=Paenibacillus konkukensis TaxID=2020716 RepID=A0ABY4RXC6_9BACL|nr:MULTISPECIES: DNA repair protein RecO [Paenibacillus]MCS7463458.1 DNA repair protein RecO [Paenibacillus doosanensis]UQZ87006.1 DNA repair protein RecO [Paenibacillus konkukensis]
MQYRVQGIVIRSMDYGEGNKIVTLFTRELGKAAVIIRGAKKVKSRYASVAQLFTCGDYLYFKSGQLGTLNHAEIVESHHRIREDLHKAAYASYMAELTDRMLPDQEANAFLFEQLKAGLQGIDEDKDMQIISFMYEMKIWMQAGYQPELDACVSCRSAEGAMRFSSSLGGILCERCRAKDPGAVPLSPGGWKLLRLFAHTDIRRLGQIDVKPETKETLKKLMRTYFDTHIGLQLKSRHFLDQMEKYGV